MKYITVSQIITKILFLISWPTGKAISRESNQATSLSSNSSTHTFSLCLTNYFILNLMEGSDDTKKNFSNQTSQRLQSPSFILELILQQETGSKNIGFVEKMNLDKFNQGPPTI